MPEPKDVLVLILLFMVLLTTSLSVSSLEQKELKTNLTAIDLDTFYSHNPIGQNQDGSLVYLFKEKAEGL